MDFLNELQWRGMIYGTTADIEKHLADEPITAYIGFDPTADSLHVGSLVQIVTLMRLQQAGHNPIAIVGGGTGMIGDPSGRSAERNLLTNDQIELNLQGIKQQLSQFLDFEHVSNPARILNNAAWLGSISMMDFLRNVGKNFTVNYMLAKESVKSRLDRETGISFTEFSYMLFQAYDYLYLYENEGCNLQLGGSDQWGNIVAGVELIRKKTGGHANGIVIPLITTASGVKFGKTAAGTIWLDPERTSPYKFYQYWYNTDDEDVISYLKYFTWLSADQIGELEQSVIQHPEKRLAQKRLAEEVTRLVHGQEAVDDAQNASRVLFGGDVSDIKRDILLDIFADVPSMNVERARLADGGARLIELLSESSLCQSNGEAKRLLKGNGISLNNKKVGNPGRLVTLDDALHNEFLILRRGSKKYFLIKLTN